MVKKFKILEAPLQTVSDISIRNYILLEYAEIQ